MKLRAVVFLFLVLGGCGANHSDLGSSASAKSAAEFFAYPYISKPIYLSDIALFIPAGAVAGLNQFTVVASLRDVADLTASTTYQVDVTTPDGTILCPTQTGSVNPLQTGISFDCVSAVVSAQVKVTLTIKPGLQAQTVFSKLF